MYDVSIPESLYLEASTAATANHVSVEAFIVEAVQLRLRQEPFRLPEDQVATVRKAQEEIKAGKGIPFDQVKQELTANRSAWLPENPH